MEKKIYQCPFSGKQFTAEVINNESCNNNGGCGNKCKPTGKKTVYEMNSDEKLAALEKAGVDVSGFFAMKGAKGGDAIARMVNGIIQMVDDDDPIYQLIKYQGTIPERRLFKRFIPSHVMSLLIKIDEANASPYGSWMHKRYANINLAIRHMGYQYSWKVIVEELARQAKMAERDPENYGKNNLAWNVDVFVAMAEDFLFKLHEHIDGLKTRKCKGVPYKRFHGHDYFISDIDKKIFAPMREIISRMQRLSYKADAVARAAQDFYSYQRRYSLSWDTEICNEFIEAYKAQGAAWLMDSFIRFQNFRCIDDNGMVLNQEDSLAFLWIKAKQYKGEGWRMWGLMKKFLDDNNFGVEQMKKMQKRWADEKKARLNR